MRNQTIFSERGLPDSIYDAVCRTAHDLYVQHKTNTLCHEIKTQYNILSNAYNAFIGHTINGIVMLF